MQSGHLDFATPHAQARMQQRGMNARAIDLIYAYGRVRHDHHGGRIVYMDRRCRDQLLRTEGKDVFRTVEKALNGYLVLGRDNALVTVGHRHRRLPTKY